ncbi:MAG TPA: M28 family peptidase [Cytophagaceae bacterium]|jgi:hypothetical protein
MKNKASKIFIVVAFLTSLPILYSCKENKKRTETVKETPAIPTPVFNEDSAYRFVESQVNFGPRVPNTAAHVKCGDYLISELKRNGAKVSVQEFEAKAWDGKLLRLRNIIGSYNENAPKRLLYAAHWDTRPFADKDSVRQDVPIDGANDGASGVGILLEIARTMHLANKPSVGLDIIFFDGEDYGELNNSSYRNGENNWCLGSQYWAKNKHIPQYNAYYGILLDMVGAANARFALEGTSMQYAPNVMKEVWQTASRLGYSSHFVFEEVSGITDDHTYINQIAKIPMLDIIERSNSDVNPFGSYHHTHKDNMSIIDKKTLKAVGHTILEVLYKE